MAKIIAGTDVTFKRIAIGDGYDYDTANFNTRTSLVNEVLSITDLTMNVNTNDTVTFTGKFSQTQLTAAFWYREVGLYVVDPDDETKEILYAYGNRNDKAEYITPNIDEYAVMKELKLYTLVGTSANVHIYSNETQTGIIINFTTSDWEYDSDNEKYTCYLGEISESLKVFKTTTSGKVNAPFVDITRNLSNATTLESFTAFNGCVVSV